jgi:hypothetical protein
MGKVFLIPIFLGKVFVKKANQIVTAGVKNCSLAYLKFQTFPIFLRMNIYCIYISINFLLIISVDLRNYSQNGTN